MDAKKKKTIIIAVVAVVVVAIIATVAVFLSKNKTEEVEPLTTASTSETSTESTTATQVLKTNPLTGEDNYNKDAIGVRPVACVVENSYYARPQWGIDDETNPPDIILEGEVEGGETRMLWFYADYTSVPSQIGPMRSARPPFIKFSEMFDAMFIHWGQSASKGNYVGAGKVFREDDVDHINQMKTTKATYLFGRDSSRSSNGVEHTGVLYGDKLAQAIADVGFRTEIDSSSYTQLNFNEEEQKLSDTACNSLTLTFSSRTSKRDWTYSSEDNMYHTYDYSSSIGSSDVARKNILVLFDTTEYIVKDNYKNSGSSETYCNYELAGGSGKLASLGTVIDITWSVEDGLLVIKDSDGNDVNLNVGKTWIGWASSNLGGSVTIG